MAALPAWAIAAAILFKAGTSLHSNVLTRRILDSGLSDLGNEGRTPKRTLNAILTKNNRGVFRPGKYRGHYELENPQMAIGWQLVQQALEALERHETDTRISLQPNQSLPGDRARVYSLAADYFDLLRKDILTGGGDIAGGDENRQLQPEAQAFRGEISATLINMGLPYIGKYEPRCTNQEFCRKQIDLYLAQNPDFLKQLSDALWLTPSPSSSPQQVDLDELIEPPPETITIPQGIDQPWLTRKGRKIDFIRQDSENRRLGRLGEEFVLDLEKRRLLAARRDDLAGKVEWIAQTCGDGVGFDILSFNERDDSERLVEVKTTGLGKFFPFYVSDLEVRCSEATGPQYHLYRVFDFAAGPKLYVLQGALSVCCRLEPVAYRAAI